MERLMIEKGVHVQTWSGADNARITDMANAGKVGKRCAVFSFQGWRPHGGEERHRRCSDATAAIMHYLDTAEDTYAALLERVQALVAEADEPDWLRVTCDEIRGVDAPVPVLSYLLDGKFSVGADKDGIHLYDIEDRANEPACITHNQSPRVAYKIAKKMWPAVTAAASFSQAWNVLSDAGAALHYWCRMD